MSPDVVGMQTALRHIEAALVLLDKAEQHAIAAQLDHVVHELASKIRLALGAS